jgi:hypothetical protein
MKSLVGAYRRFGTKEYGTDMLSLDVGRQVANNAGKKEPRTVKTSNYIAAVA